MSWCWCVGVLCVDVRARWCACVGVRVEMVYASQPQIQFRIFKMLLYPGIYHITVLPSAYHTLDCRISGAHFPWCYHCPSASETKVREEGRGKGEGEDEV